MPFFAIYNSATGSISAKVFAQNSKHAVAAGSAIALTTSEYFSLPEKWALVTSEKIMICPSSGITNAGTAIAGGGGYVQVGSVPWITYPIIDPYLNNPFTYLSRNIATPSIIFTCIHQLSIADSREVGVNFVDRAGTLIHSTSFISFNDARTFAASVFTDPESTSSVLGVKVSLVAGANVTVSSRVMTIRDSRL